MNNQQVKQKIKKELKNKYLQTNENGNMPY